MAGYSERSGAWTRTLVRMSHVPLVLALLCPKPTTAQPHADGLSTPPIAGTWEPVRSLGQPARFKPFVRGGYGLDRSGNGDQVGPLGSVGVFRDAFNPVYGALGLSLQAYAGQRGGDLDGGFQAHFESPATSFTRA